MLYLSRLLGKTVYDARRDPVGYLDDLAVAPEPGFPPLTAVYVRLNREIQVFDASLVREWGDRLTFSVNKQDLQPHYPPAGSVRLRRDVLDKQIVDLSGARVVRVNDVGLDFAAGHWRLVVVDPSTRGLLRRLRLERLGEWICRLFRFTLHTHLISWADVEPLDTEAARLRLRIPRERLGRLHPADLAELLSQLDPSERVEVIESLDPHTAADTIEDMEPEMQASVIQGLSPETASDILEEMEPDDAADVLADLPEEKSAVLLQGMQADEAEDVRRLLEYEEDSAGGLMTTNFIAIPHHYSAAQTLAHLRSLAPEEDALFSLLVVDEGGRLLGTLPLSRLILAAPDKPIAELVNTSAPKARLRDTADSVAHLITKYDLLSVPVVDEAGVLRGVVTVDDAIDLILPPNVKRRLRRGSGT